MDFSLNAEQQQLKDSVDKYMAERYSSDQRRQYLAEKKGFSDKVWQDFGELGWLTVPIPESEGGFGGTVVDTSILMEAIGGAVAVEPYLATVLLAGQLIANGDNTALKARYLEGILTGNCQAAFAYQERRSRYQLDAIDCKAEREGEGFRLTGSKTLVLNGVTADVLVVSAWLGDDIALFAVPAQNEGVQRDGFTLMDGQAIANVQFEGVQLSSESLVCPVAESMPLMRKVLDEATIGVSAQAVGAMEFLLKATVEYCNTRKQFGQPIGKFQALQHRMVDMYTATEQCRSLLVRSLCSTSGGERQAELDIAALKAMVGKHGRALAEEAVQLHGGMGVTEELNIGDYLKRLMVIDSLFGDSNWQRRRFATLRYQPQAA
jgi:alkylation response protein AidB-like acyl-CoA dehydrogenase